MSKTKTPSRKKQQEQGEQIGFWGPWLGRRELIASLLLALLAAGAVLLYVLPLESRAGAAAFPSDDPWISLNFAKNIQEYGAYSYFRDQMVTSGSTSPLYVLLLALLGFVLPDPLAAASFIGAIAFAAASVFVFRFARHVFVDEHWLAFAAALLFVLFPRMQSAASSGQATMLFIACITGAAAMYAERKSLWFFICIGLGLWVRPDALVFLIAALFHIFYHHRVVTRVGVVVPSTATVPVRVSPAAVRAGSAVFVVMVLLYAGFNVALSGTVFPNSIGAKLAYYQNASTAVFTSGAFEYFTTSVGVVLFLPAVLGLVLLAIDFVKRRAAPLLSGVLFIAGLLLAYGLFLPTLPDDARYLAPAVPFYILLALWGVRRLFALLSSTVQSAGPARLGRGLSGGVAVVTLIVSIAGIAPSRDAYYKAVRYIADRHIAAATWLRQNTNPDAVIATHAIGAIAYYGNRRIVDVTGIVTPELVSSIGDLGKLETYIAASGVTHYAMLRERFEVVNVNPVFSSDKRVPGVMEVLPFIPKRSHILAQAASAANARAASLMAGKLDREALGELQASYRIDPASSRTSTLLGICFLNLGDTAQAKIALEQALQIQDDYAPAMVPLGDIYSNAREYTAAVRLLSDALRIAPDSPIARDSFKRAVTERYRDSLAAVGFRPMQLGGR